MTDAAPKRTGPFSLRLSHVERKALEVRAAGIPLGSFIRSQLFDASQTAGGSWTPLSTANDRSLAQLLGMLGKSDLASNLDRLARAAENGTLSIDNETAALLRAACADVRTMKRMLMRELRIKER